MSTNLSGGGDGALTKVGLSRLPLPVNFGSGTVNAYLHRGDALTLIDTGVNRAASREALEAALAQEGVQLGDIERILLTHHHGDHAGLAGEIVGLSGAECCGHEDVAAYSALPHDPDVRRVAFEEMALRLGVPQPVIDGAMAAWHPSKVLGAPVAVSRTLGEGDRIGAFRVHCVPGHSPTDLLFVNEQDGYTVVGDHLLRGMTAVPALQPAVNRQERMRGLVAYDASLRRSAELIVGWCCPGHGDSFSDHRSVIDKMFRRFESRAERVLGALGADELSAYALSTALYPRAAEGNYFRSLSGCAGTLEWLSESGRVTVAYRDGIDYYRSVVENP